MTYIFRLVKHIVKYVALNDLQGVSMHTCKTHIVGTQRRKTHIIAGVLTILGCISGVCDASPGGSGAARTRNATTEGSDAAVSNASPSGTAVLNAGGNGGGTAVLNAGVSDAAVVGTVASPRSARGDGAAGVGQDGTHYTFALPSGDKMILDGITREKTVAILLINADTTVGDLFKQLYEKAKSEYERTKLPHYDWSGPEIIRITAEDGKIVHELHGDIYNEKLKDVFGNHANLIITRGEPVQGGIEVKEFTITDQVLLELCEGPGIKIAREIIFYLHQLPGHDNDNPYVKLLNEYLDRWNVLQLSSPDPSEDLVKFFNTFIKKESQAIYDKLAELTHLKNRPKESVDHNIMVEYQGTIRGPLTVVIIPLRSGHSIKITTEATQETIKWQYLSNNASLNVNEDETTSIEKVDSSLYQNSLKYEWIRWFLSDKGGGDRIIRILCETQGSRGLTDACKYLLQHKTDFQKYVVEHFKVEGQKFTKSQEIFDFVADNDHDQYEPRLNQVFFDFILNEIRNGNKQIITFHKMVGGNRQVTSNIAIDKSDTEALIRAVKNRFPELQDRTISVKLYCSDGARKKTLYIEEGNLANVDLRAWLNEQDTHYKVNALIGDMLKVTVTGENNESRTIKTSTIHSISEFISQVKVAFGIQEQGDKCLILVPTSMEKEKLNYPAQIEAADTVSDNYYYNRYSDCWYYV